MSSHPTLCVRSTPIRRYIDGVGLSHLEVGRMYSDRFTPGKDSSATVNRLLNHEMIPIYAADKLAILLDLHPLNVWDREEYENPVPISGGLKEHERKRRELVGAS